MAGLAEEEIQFKRCLVVVKMNKRSFLRCFLIINISSPPPPSPLFSHHQFHFFNIYKQIYLLSQNYFFSSVTFTYSSYLFFYAIFLGIIVKKQSRAEEEEEENP